MSSQVIASNVSIKISGAISFGGYGTGTPYTCPANSYAIIQVYFSGGGSAATIAVGGKTVCDFGTVSFVGNIFVGPGQSVTYVGNNFTLLNITGVQFTNSP